MTPPSFHESYTRPEQPSSSSNRRFGFVMAVACTAVAFWPVRHGGGMRTPFAVAAVLFLLTAALIPNQLAPLNALWTRFGMVLARVTNPVVMAILFYGIITPAGFVARRAGWLTLIRKTQPDRQTYWLPRVPAGPAEDSFTRQF